MRVKHTDTGILGTVVSGEPEHFMGEPAWRVIWDGDTRPTLMFDEVLIVLD